MNYEAAKMTAMVNAYSLFRIPLLAFITPQIEELSEKRSTVYVRLDLRTRNHLGVMYFGALAMGAELAISARALKEIAASGKKIDFIFKDFQAEFLKRADSHVRFICDEADLVATLIAKAAGSEERHHQAFSGYAIVPSKSTDPVMKFKLTMSVRQRTKK